MRRLVQETADPDKLRKFKLIGITVSSEIDRDPVPMHHLQVCHVFICAHKLRFMILTFLPIRLEKLDDG